MLPGGSLSGNLDGGGSPSSSCDWLDYSAYAAGVRVNLTTGKATAVGASVKNIEGILGGHGDDRLTGGATPTALLGGAGKDELTAGSGRAILLGGDGQDTLHGGDDDTILIGDRTTYDQNTAALDAFLEVWSTTMSRNQPYTTAQLIQAIHAGVGPSAYRFDSATVTDDSNSDQLLSGMGNDWFLATTSGANADGVRNPKAADRVN
jgi:hypothetical protein